MIWVRWFVVGLIAAPLCGTELEVIEVVETTPLGAMVRRDNLAGEIQVATEEDLRRDRTISLADYMNENFTSVLINEAQSNPLQPDIQYRGFIGSPLLGLPQGIAVYQDGVRINEPFGDTISWALIPNNAIANVAFIPGSNPLFGRNALGGSLSYKTKTGFGDPAIDLVAAIGSNGLEQFDLSGGISNEDWATYSAISFFQEDGWRDFSPSERLQWFSSLSKRGDRSETTIRITHGTTSLIGNGPVPVDLLAIDRASVFTRPDETKNEAMILSLDSEHQFDELSVHFNGYRRWSDIDTFNGDDSDYEACEDAFDFLCLEDDELEQIVTDRHGQRIYAEDSLEGATANRSATDQVSDGYGIEIRSPLWTIGLHREVADIDFFSSTELGALDSTRRAIPGGIFVGNAFTELGTEVTANSLYAFSSWPLSNNLSAQFSGRWGDTRVKLNDRIGTALDGDHSFRRFNPAVGITWRLSDISRLYLSYSESNRVPSPVELTCADEDAPCRLPNAFLADPPLKDVVAKTWEIGMHRFHKSLDWHASIFRTLNQDDIIFISAGRFTNQGYFDNVGKTQRVGFEVALSGETEKQLSWYAKYTWLKATFEESFRVSSVNHPKAQDGEIAVSRGDLLPLIPQNQLKLGIDYVWQRFRLGMNLQSRSASYLRGDEGNAAASLKKYAVVNADLTYQLRKNIDIFAKMQNVLDSDFETFGLFGEADEVLGGDFTNPRFLSPGAPRAFRLGFQVLLGSR